MTATIARKGRPPTWTTEQKDHAVALARQLGSIREAERRTGIGRSCIRLHARATGQPLTPTAGVDVDTWVRDLAAKILDGLDLTALAVADGLDPDTATRHLNLITAELREPTR